MVRETQDGFLQRLTPVSNRLGVSDGPCHNVSENAQEELADLEILCGCLHAENDF